MDEFGNWLYDYMKEAKANLDNYEDGNDKEHIILQADFSASLLILASYVTAKIKGIDNPCTTKISDLKRLAEQKK